MDEVTFYRCYVQARAGAPPHARATAEWVSDKGMWLISSADNKGTERSVSVGPRFLSDEAAASELSRYCDGVGIRWRPTAADMSLTRAGKHPKYESRRATETKADSMVAPPPPRGH